MTSSHIRTVTRPADAMATDDALNGERNEELEECVHRMITPLGDDPTREGLARTPLRVAKAMQTLTSGYSMSIDHIVNNAILT